MEVQRVLLPSFSSAATHVSHRLDKKDLSHCPVRPISVNVERLLRRVLRSEASKVSPDERYYTVPVLYFNQTGIKYQLKAPLFKKNITMTLIAISKSLRLRSHRVLSGWCNIPFMSIWLQVSIKVETLWQGQVGNAQPGSIIRAFT